MIACPKAAVTALLFSRQQNAKKRFRAARALHNRVAYLPWWLRAQKRPA